MSKNKKILLTFACLVFFFLSVVQAQAQSSVPTKITLQVYQLDPDDGSKTNTVCTKGAMKYGCTAYSDKEDNPNYPPEDYGYPFDSTDVNPWVTLFF